MPGMAGVSGPNHERPSGPTTCSGRLRWEPKEEPVIGKANARHGWSLRTESRETIRAGDMLGRPRWEPKEEPVIILECLVLTRKT
jgi:hypothetical protein